MAKKINTEALEKLKFMQYKMDVLEDFLNKEKTCFHIQFGMLKLDDIGWSEIWHNETDPKKLKVQNSLNEAEIEQIKKFCSKVVKSAIKRLEKDIENTINNDLCQLSKK